MYLIALLRVSAPPHKVNNICLTWISKASFTQHHNDAKLLNCTFLFDSPVVY